MKRTEPLEIVPNFPPKMPGTPLPLKNQPEYEKPRRKTMNPMIKKYIGSLIRTLLAGIAPFLVSMGLTEDDSTRLVTLLAGFIAAQVWSLWEKVTSRKKLVTAMAMDRSSEMQVMKVIDDGRAPSTSTPADAVPTLSRSKA